MTRTRPVSRRAVLALATGTLVLGGLAGPALATSSLTGTDTVGTDSEHFCVYTRYDHRTGEGDGFCVWIPDVLPKTPAAS